MQNNTQTAGKTATFEELKADAMGIALSLRDPLKQLYKFNPTQIKEDQHLLECIIDGLYHLTEEEDSSQQTNGFDLQITCIKHEYEFNKNKLRAKIAVHWHAIGELDRLIEGNRQDIHNLNRELAALQKDYRERKCAIEVAKDDYYTEYEPNRYLGRLLHGFLEQHPEVTDLWKGYVDSRAQEGGAQ